MGAESSAAFPALATPPDRGQGRTTIDDVRGVPALRTLESYGPNLLRHSSTSEMMRPISSRNGGECNDNLRAPTNSLRALSRRARRTGTTALICA